MHSWHEADHALWRLELERFSALVDPRNPATGLSGVRVDASEVATLHPLGVELSPVGKKHDEGFQCYARGGDLVATYVDRPAPDMRSVLYWRAAAHELQGAIAAIELVASVETSSLDSRPQLAVRTSLVASEAYRLVDAARGSFAAIVPLPSEPQGDDAPEAPACHLFRLPGRRYSYAEMVQPADGRQSHWEGWLAAGDYRFELRHELFAQRLEKGVILRARVLGMILDRDDDQAAVLAHWNSFLREPLPLTA
jgi:hypothetical protein